MTDVVTNAYQTLLRDQHPHASLHYMSIYEPQLVYVGQVSGSPARGARAITVTNVTGSIASVRAEDSVYVGSAAGSHSKSIRRLKSRAGQVLTVDENSVVWASGDYISVYHDTKLWGVWPRIYDAGNGSYVFVKDYDTAYSGQNLQPPPVALMGWHRSKFMYGTSVTFVLNATGSYAIAYGATISAYAWSCSTGTIASASASSTTITFTTTGQHEVSLTVTDSNGKTQTTRRIYFVHGTPGPTASYPPFIDFSIDSGISLDWSQGGGRVSITMRGDDVDDIVDNTMIVIWGENYFNGSLSSASLYNGSSQLAALKNDGNAQVKFVGYLSKQQVWESDEVGKVVVEAYTIDELMKRTTMASVSLTNVSSPTKWYEMYKLTVTRAVHHYWRYHSNLFTIADVLLPTDDTIELYACDDLVEGNLYQSPDTFAYQHGIFAHVCCDKYSRVHLARDSQSLGVADRAAISDYMTIGKTDVKMKDTAEQSSIEIVRDTFNRVSLVTVRGASYSAGTVTPLISQAPGEVPEFGEGSSIIERLVFSSQSHANVLSGRLYYVANREFVELRITMAGNYYDILDVVPHTFLVVPTGTFENLLGVEVGNDYIIKSINYTAGTNGVVEVQLILEPDVDSVDGITIQWPDDPTEIEDPGERPKPPEDPGDPPPPPPPPPVVWGLLALVSTDSCQVKQTSDITAVSPTWSDKT